MAAKVIATRLLLAVVVWLIGVVEVAGVRAAEIGNNGSTTVIVNSIDAGNDSHSIPETTVGVEVTAADGVEVTAADGVEVTAADGVEVTAADEGDATSMLVSAILSADFKTSEETATITSGVAQPHAASIAATAVGVQNFPATTASVAAQSITAADSDTSADTRHFSVTPRSTTPVPTTAAVSSGLVDGAAEGTVTVLSRATTGAATGTTAMVQQDTTNTSVSEGKDEGQADVWTASVEDVSMSVPLNSADEGASAVVHNSTAVPALESTTAGGLEDKSPDGDGSCESCRCGVVHSARVGEDVAAADCSFLGLHDLPHDLPLQLESLSVRGNAINSVADTLPRLNHLRELDASGNRIRSLGRGGLFQNMTRLQYLNLGKNAITTIFHDSLAGPAALRDLVLVDNKITYIEDKAFLDLSSLVTLDLQQNLIGSLYSEWFHGLSNLRSLNLAHNRIHKVPPSVFRDLSALTRLNLAGNRISKVDPRAFSGLMLLADLTMEGNLLDRVPTTAFQSLPGLTKLTLDQNPLVKVKPLDLSHMNVSELSLSRMPQLEIIDAKAFFNLAKVTTIAITDNPRLAYVDPKAFEAVSSLRDLLLHHNHLAGITRDLAGQLPPGVALHLYSNPLRCDCNVRWLRQAVAANTSGVVVMEPQRLVCASPPELAHKLVRDLNVTRVGKTCGPTIVEVGPSASVGKVGERHVLECRALGWPKPSLHWLLPDGSTVNTTINEVRRRFVQPGTLVYYHLTLAEAGRYTCVARNALGTATLDTFLNVTDIDVHLWAVRVSSTWVTLVWNGTERRAYPSYTVLSTPLHDNGTARGPPTAATASPARKTFVVSRLDPDTQYRFCLGYRDASDYWLQISCCVAHTHVASFLAQDTFQYPRATSAVAAVLLLTVVACVASAASRRMRHRMYETPDKTSDDATIPLDTLQRPLLARS